MKQIITLIIVASLFVGCTDKQVKLTPDLSEVSGDASNLLLEEQYEKGYAQAIKDNKEFLINLGFQKAMGVLDRLLTNEKAICVGGYAIEESFVTNPKIISTSNGNKSVGLKVIGCKIDKKKTPQQLLAFYSRYASIIPTVTEDEYVQMKRENNYYSFDSLTSNTKPKGNESSSSSSQKTKDKDRIVSVDVVGGNDERELNMVNEADFDRFKYTTRVAKNNNNTNLLHRYELPVREEEGYYVIGFGTEGLLDTFCNVTRTCEY